MLLHYKPDYLKNLSLIGCVVILVFCLFYCFDYLLQISVSVFLPHIKHQFALNNFKLGLIGSVFFVTYVAMQIPGGYLIDELGSKKMATLMAFVCAIGALMMYASSNYYRLLVSRLLIGLGSSVAFLCALYAIAQWAPKSWFAFFVGVLQALAGLGAIFGQSPVAYINHFYTWNQIALGFAVVALVFTALFGIVISRSGAHPSLFEDNYSPRASLKDYWDILKRPALLKLALLGFIAWSPVASLAGFWFMQHLNVAHHIAPVVAGSMIITFWVGLIIGSLLTPIISELIKRRRPLLISGFALQFIAVLLICFQADNLYLMSVALFVLGLVAPLQGFTMVVAKDISAQKGFGVATGMLNMFGTLSGGVMQFLIGFLLTYCFVGIAHPYLWAFSSYLILAAIGLYISVFRLKESHPNKPSPLHSPAPPNGS
jgi:MFS family permease